ncbi:MAG: tRNA uridine-5-carboxymethylaminomethyl(34) synthesis GTPase MnmE [Rhodospirillaceae bacterium]|nr:tRNA uridine-5-carboxymethylaminomethyl(34) synthesis GTPase MnmE [Rhodospirillaceae bacterium]
MTTRYDETIFALATTPGRSSIAVIRISGELAKTVCGIFNFQAPPPRVAGVRALEDARRKLDEAMVIFFEGPRSFTGEDMVELHLHGGRAVVEAILGALGKQPGLRMAEAGEFTKRAVINGKIDLTEAEGVNDLISAQTEAQRVQSLHQMEGGPGKQFNEWCNTMVQMAAHVEAYIDFPEEEIPKDILAGIEGNINSMIDDMEDHLNDNRRGEILRDGLRVAVIGPPNAGKSSFVNWLAQRDIAITSDQAGTTRDIIEVSLDLDGYPAVLADTAGLRESIDPLETKGIERAREWAKMADIRIILVAAPELRCWQKSWAPTGPDDIVIINKIDLENPVNQPPGMLKISLKKKEGLTSVLERLHAVAKNKMSGQEPAIITKARHREALEASVAGLKRAQQTIRGACEPELLAEDFRATIQSLGRVTGRVDIEDLLDVIFNDFCIGK